MCAMAESVEHKRRIKVVSFNMHGFNQGCAAIDELISNYSPDVVLLQEHWLTPVNLHKFDDNYANYFSFGCSAMSKNVESGMLSGRPFGGVMCLVNNNLRKLSETIYCSERFAVIKVCNCIIINVYLPCVGTADRLLICEDLLTDAWAWRERFTDCECIIAGDFNTDLNSSDIVSTWINAFSQEHSLIRCDNLFPMAKTPTYINSALNHQSIIDYILISSQQIAADYVILDLDINFSDHLPLLGTFELSGCNNVNNVNEDLGLAAAPVQLRWDHADTLSYYQYSGHHLQPVLYHIDNAINQFDKRQLVDYNSVINLLHDDIVNILACGVKIYIPHCKKNFFKFWWDEELNLLKEASIESNQIWKAAGKPRHGPIFNKRQSCRLQYCSRIRDGQKATVTSYTNDLHCYPRTVPLFGNAGALNLSRPENA
jgi:exonuclease III